jgi:hypothetical protein
MSTYGVVRACYIKCVISIAPSPWNQPLAEMQEKTAYIRPKVIEPFPRPYTSGSYMHRAALFYL